MKEWIKSAILFVLVVSSVVLTWFLIFYSPNNNNVSLSEYLPRIKFGQDIDFKQVVKSKQIIYHFGNNEHTIVRPNKIIFTQIEEEMVDWSFYDFSPIYSSISWKEMTEDIQGFEIIFPSSLSHQFLNSMFGIPKTNIVLDNINRLWITIDHEENVQAYFISDERDRVYNAKTSITNQKLKQYVSQAILQPKYSYHWVYSNKDLRQVKQMYYVPIDGISMKMITKSYTPVSVEDFTQLLFIDPSMVREYEMENKKNILYTDGNRSMQYSPLKQHIIFYQHVSESKDFNLEKDTYAAIRFVNQHGGWDKNYHLEKASKVIGSNRATIKFRQYIEGFPLLGQDNTYGIINMEVTDSIVNLFQRSMILLDNYKDIKVIKTHTEAELFKLLEEKQIIADIKSIELFYNVNKNEKDIVLEPYWKIEVKGEEQIEIPAFESVVQ